MFVGRQFRNEFHFAFEPLVAASDDQRGTSWLGSDDGVATLRVPLADADSVTSSSAFELDRRGEALLASPVHPALVLLGKGLPYLVPGQSRVAQRVTRHTRR